MDRTYRGNRVPLADRRTALLAWLGALAMLAAACGGSEAAPDVADQVEEILAEATPGPSNSAVVFAQVAPSFVIVQVDRASTGGNDDRVDRGLGSGVIINADGDILTARHVVVDADAINVTFGDGTTAPAEVSSVDPARDIAVLRAEQGPEVLVPAVVGSIATMATGDPVYVIGNPLGLPASISSGVISGFNRTLPLGDDGEQLAGLIQFDAAVNPGNSGGPLVNRSGHVVGIVTALVNPTDQPFFSGIGFAVPIALATGAAGAPAQ